jgi:hypothetical protein
LALHWATRARKFLSFSSCWVTRVKKTSRGIGSFASTASRLSEAWKSNLNQWLYVTTQYSLTMDTKMVQFPCPFFLWQNRIQLNSFYIFINLFYIFILLFIYFISF